MLKTIGGSRVIDVISATLMVLGFGVGAAKAYTGTTYYILAYLVLLAGILLIQMMIMISGRVSLKTPNSVLTFGLVSFFITIPFLFQNPLGWFENYGFLMIWAALNILFVARGGRRYVGTLLGILTIFLMFINVENLIQYFNKMPPFYSRLIVSTNGSYNYAFGTETYRTMSYFGHPIPAGLFFAFSFFVFRKLKISYVGYFFQLLSLVNLYTTQSRSDWLAFAGAYLLIYVFRVDIDTKKNNLIDKIFIILITIFGVFAFGNRLLSGIVSRFGDTLTLHSTSGSNLQRTGTIQLIFQNFKESDVFLQLFGHGVKTSPAFMASHTILIPFFTTTDNQYLTFLYDFGLVGLVGFVIFYIYFLFKSRNSEYAWWGWSSVLIVMISQFFFEAATPPIYLLLILGMIVGSSSLDEQN